MKHWLLAAILAVPVVGCGSAPDPSETTGAPAPSAQGLSLEKQTDDLITGRYTDGVVSLDFLSEKIAENVFHARIQIGDNPIDYTLDNANGKIEYTGRDHAFNTEEVEALKSLEIALGVLRNAKEAEAYNKVEAVLFSLTTLATDTVPGEVLTVMVKPLTRGWVNIGCGNYCRDLWRSCGGSGWYYKQTGINSPNCKGRCGAGCGDARSNGATRWTMDCAEHDYHLGPLGDCLDDGSYANTTTYRCGTTSSEWCASNCSCQPTGSGC